MSKSNKYVHPSVGKKYYICAYCNKNLYYAHFIRHLKNVHNISAKDYYHEFLAPNTKPNHCLNCDKELQFQEFNFPYRDFCSKACQAKYNSNLGEESKNRWSNPEYRTQMTKLCKKIAKDRWDSVPEHVKKAFNSQRNKNIKDVFQNPNLIIANASRGGKSGIGKKLSKSHRDKISKSVSNTMKLIKEICPEKFKINNKRYKQGWHYSNKVKSGKIYYDSSYELQAFKILDQLITVKEYEKEPFAIEYVYKDRTHNYWPDLLIIYTNNQKQLIEIKPSSQINFDINQTKFKAALEYCSKDNEIINFQVWTEKEIF